MAESALNMRKINPLWHFVRNNESNLCDRPIFSHLAEFHSSHFDDSIFQAGIFMVVASLVDKFYERLMLPADASLSLSLVAHPSTKKKKDAAGRPLRARTPPLLRRQERNFSEADKRNQATITPPSCCFAERPLAPRSLLEVTPAKPSQRGRRLVCLTPNWRHGKMPASKASHPYRQKCIPSDPDRPENAN